MSTILTHPIHIAQRKFQREKASVDPCSLMLHILSDIRLLNQIEQGSLFAVLRLCL